MSHEIYKKLQQLEVSVKNYYAAQSQYLPYPISFNFSFFREVYDLIKLMPLTKDKIQLMERFELNVRQKLSSIHPKLNYSFNFSEDINLYKPLIEQLDSLNQQARSLFNDYFAFNRPVFNWHAFRNLRNQISNIPNQTDKKQLMLLFENNVLQVISQVEPKVYASFTFTPELAEMSSLDSKKQ